MGDIVGSETAPSADQLYTAFNEAVTAENAVSKPVSPLTITLGDEFQGLYGTLTEALDAAWSLRLNLMNRRIECRFVIGIASIETTLNTFNAWNMMGEGLSRARQKLDEKSPDNLYRFSFFDNARSEKLLEAIGQMLTAIERRWTGSQREVIVASLQDMPIARDLAHRRNVSAHSIYKVRAAGDFRLYRVGRAALAESMADLDGEYGLS